MSASTLLSIAGAVLVAIRQLTQRSFHVNRLWIMPTVIVVVVALSFGHLDLSLVGLVVSVAGAVIGSLMGLMRARTQLRSIDVPGRKIVTKPNVVMVLLFTAFVIAKAILRQGSSAGVSDATNFGLFVTAASVCAQRLEFYRLFQRAEVDRQTDSTH